MAWRGVAWRGAAGQGSPLVGELRIVPAAVDCYGKARSGAAGRGMAWLGMARQGIGKVSFLFSKHFRGRI